VEKGVESLGRVPLSKACLTFTSLTAWPRLDGHSLALRAPCGKGRSVASKVWKLCGREHAEAAAIAAGLASRLGQGHTDFGRAQLTHGRIILGWSESSQLACWAAETC